MCDRGYLVMPTWVGTHEGGAFEAPSLVVVELDGLGRVRHFDQYDLDQLDVARAHLDAIDPRTARDPLAALARPNAATAAMDRLQAAFEARDWVAIRAACTMEAIFDDRRRRTLVSGDVDWWIADMQRIVRANPNVRYERQLVGAAGERVDLERVLWSGGPPEGQFELEYLRLTEVDETGRVVSAVAFDLDDRRIATRETRARWFAEDAIAAAVVGPMTEFHEAFSDHDRARVRAVLADDLVVHDRRRAGFGLVEGADAYLDSLAALWDLAPDIHFESSFSLALERYGSVSAGRSFGMLAEGGAFERYLVSVSTVEHGLVTRFEMFELEDAGAALTRLAELRPDPLRIPPNAATRATDRSLEAMAARNWKALYALSAPTLLWEDRRRMALTTGDRDMFIANARFIARSRGSRTGLATAGDRLALSRLVWTGSDDRLAFEVEMLEVVEVDAEGRIVAIVDFDPDDRRAASAELFERYARSDAARCIPASAFEGLRATNAHDLERLRALLPDDFVFHDRRRTGVGRLEGATAFVASLAVVFEQTPDIMDETLYDVATEKHGNLVMARMLGTLAEGGGEVEYVYARLMLYQGDRIVGMESFEPEDLDVARARFEELRPDP